MNSNVSAENTTTNGKRPIPVAAQKVTINAAFLQEIKEDNQHLRSVIKKVRSICNARPTIRLRRRRFADLLAELRDQLAMHFSLEEAYPAFLTAGVVFRDRWSAADIERRHARSAAFCGIAAPRSR